VGFSALPHDALSFRPLLAARMKMMAMTVEKIPYAYLPFPL
jgi:hypothetical protein